MMAGSTIRFACEWRGDVKIACRVQRHPCEGIVPIVPHRREAVQRGVGVGGVQFEHCSTRVIQAYAIGEATTVPGAVKIASKVQSQGCPRSRAAIEHGKYAGLR